MEIIDKILYDSDLENIQAIRLLHTSDCDKVVQRHVPVVNNNLENERCIPFMSASSNSEISGSWNCISGKIQAADSTFELIFYIPESLSLESKQKFAMALWCLQRRPNEQRQVHDLTRWEKLNQGYSKCNTDGTMFKEQNCFVAGICIRNNHGHMLVGNMLSNRYTQSLEVEASALLNHYNM
ncbi:hypothetical protein VNO78_23060 [Psophocarpus tetragonolobus]|uniref:RNase H type-1 domain-containing protein n=1 Tax=Psophocarpus tetragonolobus TaxID=3891 RepID=A0AAN9S2M2_PSOTE